MSDYEIAVERLTAWLRDYGDEKPKPFIGDLTIVLLVSQDAARLQAENAELKAEVERMLTAITRINHFATGTCNLHVLARLRCIEGECKAIEFRKNTKARK